MPDVRIFAESYTTSTRAYVTEHVCMNLVFDGQYYELEGKYKWMNRPWQKFAYQSAALAAIKRPKLPAYLEPYRELFIQCLEENYDLDRAIDAFNAQARQMAEAPKED